MQYKTLSDQNAYLRKMLVQAGLDAAARDVAERIQSVLTAEIHHRMKNMLAMVSAVVRQTMRTATDMAEAEAAIGKRLMAMAKAQDILLKVDLQNAGLLEIVSSAVDQHDSSDRITVAGDDLQIASAAILPLTLVLNELCTNATKYGALSKEGGHVVLTCAEDKVGQALTLRWIESGGPAVDQIGPKSFGTRLIEDALPRQLGAQGHLTFAPGGVTFELVIPLANLRPPPGVIVNGSLADA